MQIHEYDIKRIHSDIKECRKAVEDFSSKLEIFEKELAEFRESLVNYKQRYGEQPIQEWLESLDASKNVDVEE